jgi:formylglycine-generating enzyme required for sulfatase activity/tRNA A-37 threonylcarbamoyl transferase component Bud32
VDPEALYDEYLDLLASGDALSPERFLAARDLDPAADPDLLDALRRLHEAAPPPPAVALQPEKGRVLGDFRLIERLGEGGMGVVWLAEQVSLRRRVALKVLRGEIAMSRGAHERLEREARAVGQLSHPGIARVHAVGDAKGGSVRFIAMELIGGRGLDEILADARRDRVPVPPTRVAAWGSQIARALHAAHDHQIVHRDVKPSNIRIEPPPAPAQGPGRAVLLDFGLARDLASDQRTLTETFVGTPHYAAPEQVGRGGGAIDPRTDVYALGTVLYEALTGTPPTAGNTLEQVLVSILTDEPDPPHKKSPSTPRDLSIVVMKALAKDPAKRYASAAALADDLDAVLELRPISARAPGPLERASRWARRNRAAAAAIAAFAFAGMIGAGVWIAQHRADSQRLIAEISDTLAQARVLTTRYANERETLREMELRYEDLYRRMQTSHLTPQQDAEIDAAEHTVDRARRERDLLFHGALDLASRAERLGAERADVERLRALIYLEHYYEAEQALDPAGTDVYRDLIRKHDATGEADAIRRGVTSLRVQLDPPEAEVHLFRRVPASTISPDAQTRTIPVPLRDTSTSSPRPPLASAHPVLRVVRGMSWGPGPDDALDPEDLILDLDGMPFDLRGAFKAEARAALGGYAATVWRGGRATRVTIPNLAEPMIVRATAAPLFANADSRVTATEISPSDPESGRLALDAESYILLARAPGREPVRLTFKLTRNERAVIDLALLPIGTTPPGWVRVPRKSDADRTPTFLIMEREVTVREYHDFLNHPTTQARLAADPNLRLEPRDDETARGLRDEQGRFTIPQGWDPEWPIIFITHHAAKAYAAWKTDLARDAGVNLVYDLPNEDQWVRAAAAAEGDRYVWGPRFRAKWTSSCFAIPSPSPEPIRSYPIDESALGVYDLAGSASEWTTILWVQGQTYMKHAGGAWGTGEPGMFTVYGGNGTLPETRGGMIGFRLVATLRP